MDKFTTYLYSASNVVQDPGAVPRFLNPDTDHIQQLKCSLGVATEIRDVWCLLVTSRFDLASR